MLDIVLGVCKNFNNLFIIIFYKVFVDVVVEFIDFLIVFVYVVFKVRIMWGFVIMLIFGLFKLRL